MGLGEFGKCFLVVRIWVMLNFPMANKFFDNGVRRCTTFFGFKEEQMVVFFILYREKLENIKIEREMILEKMSKVKIFEF